ncbi:MAG: hypothetical protein EU548_03040, partial [Promethearchaeota archaeon]
MANSEWTKIDFQTFINKYDKDIVLNSTPTFLYSKKDKEHEAYNSLIAFFFVAGILLIYIALSIIVMSVYYNLVSFVLIVAILIVVAAILIVNYLLTNVPIKPKEIWIEIYMSRKEEDQSYLCL